MENEKLTLRVQQSLNDAYDEAVRYNHQQLDIIHLFSALLNQKDGLIPSVFEKMGVNLEGLKSRVALELNRMPQVLGEGARSSGITATRRINEVLLKAEDISAKFNDSYISVEHVMLAIMDIDAKGTVGKILKEFNITKDRFMEVLSQVRGNQRVVTNDPEGTYDALAKYGTNLVELAKKSQA